MSKSKLLVGGKNRLKSEPPDPVSSYVIRDCHSLLLPMQTLVSRTPTSRSFSSGVTWCSWMNNSGCPAAADPMESHANLPSFSFLLGPVQTPLHMPLETTGTF